MFAGVRTPRYRVLYPILRDPRRHAPEQHRRGASGRVDRGVVDCPCFVPCGGRVITLASFIAGVLVGTFATLFAAYVITSIGDR